MEKRLRSGFLPDVSAASTSVLLELMAILGAYRDALVLVGGWAPYFLIETSKRPDDKFEHVGSIDIDLAVDPNSHLSLQRWLQRRSSGS